MKKLAVALVAFVLAACSAPQQPTLAHTVANTIGATVALEVVEKQGEPNKVFCAGTAIRPGVILTNRHCVVAVGESQIFVRFHDGRVVPVDTFVIAADGETSMPQWGDDRARATDAALLFVDPSATQQIAKLSDTILPIGSEVFAIGSPKGLIFTVTFGHIAAALRDLADPLYGPNFWIQHDAAINPGNSGGGLFNRDGELIGINTLTGGDNLSLSVPMHYVLIIFAAYL